jgi:endonuclease G, mitochondrial
MASLTFLLRSLLLLLLLAGCTPVIERTLNPTTTNPNALLGKPTPANSFNADDYLIDRPQYVLSYNRSKGIPNWVSWQLTSDWLGDLPRPQFETDNSLPQGWQRITPADYSGSGFDRGHMAPAADRNRTAADSRAVFLMTNIIPQSPDNNRGPWEGLESYCRRLVNSGKTLFITAGTAGVGGKGEKGEKQSIARGKVTVPAMTWKVVVVSDRPNPAIADITEQTRVIAVLMPNQQGIKERSWQEFQTSVDQIEQMTGYDLLANLPKSVQDAIEAKAGDR